MDVPASPSTGSSICASERRLEVYAQPSGPADAAGYGRRRDFGPGDVVPVTLDGTEIGRLAVDDLLP